MNDVPRPDGNRDHVLQSVALWAEGGTRTPITLSVGGLLITGFVVSADEYLAKVEQSLGDSIQPTMKAWVDDQVAIRSARPLILPKADYAFLHLADATILNGTLRTPPAPWRCSIYAVDAFAFGELGPESVAG